MTDAQIIWVFCSLYWFFENFIQTASRLLLFFAFAMKIVYEVLDSSCSSFCNIFLISYQVCDIQHFYILQFLNLLSSYYDARKNFAALPLFDRKANLINYESKLLKFSNIKKLKSTNLISHHPWHCTWWYFIKFLWFKDLKLTNWLFWRKNEVSPCFVYKNNFMTIWWNLS